MNFRRLLPAVILLLGAVPVRADDKEPAPPAAEPERVLLATIESDPRGEATRLAREALTALEAEEPDRALDSWLELAAKYENVLLPLDLFGARLRGRTDGALHWKVRKAVNHAIARLPEAQRQRAEKAWAPAVGALWQRAARGSVPALEALASRYPVTGRGRLALRLLATRDHEAGRLVAVTRRLETWLELDTEASIQERARVALQLADALIGLEDAGGLAALVALHHDLRDVPVETAEGPVTLGDRAAAARARLRSRPTPEPGHQIQDLGPRVVLWSRSLRDPRLLRQDQEGDALVLQAGAWGRGETLVLHEGRVVRRLDTSTGLERWRFPKRAPPTLHDPVERYQDYDLPWRSVTPAGDAVLVVLGDPAASGRYTFLDTEYDATEEGQELRLRLACLDLATGKLRWYTGGFDESDPVLGDLTTGCCAPPLVVGDAVYAVFARRAGATKYYLAKLDLATGRPRFVTPLVGGESGRDHDASRDGRFTNPFLHSVPWGSRPTLADGEVCVVPAAGFAAGVGAAKGEVRWARALPRYGMDETVPAFEGHSGRNVPIPWGDAWIVAAMDSPRMMCLARGTGDLRWERGGRTPSELPPWRDVLGIVPDEDGRPRLRLVGYGPLLMDPADGALQFPDVDPFDLGAPVGRAVDRGGYVLRLCDGALQARAWRSVGDTALDSAFVALETDGVPLDGDIVEVDGVEIVIGPERVAALAPPAHVVPWADPAAHAAALAMQAGREGDAEALSAAVEAAHQVPAGDLRERVYDRLVAGFERAVLEQAGSADEAQSLARLGEVARTLPLSRQGLPIRLVAERMFNVDEDAHAARLLLYWLETADDTLVRRGLDLDPTRDDRLRGDLLAAMLLRAHADRPGVTSVLAPWRDAAAARMGLLLAQGNPDEATLRETVRHAAGTRAAHEAREALAERLQAAGRLDEAAAVYADMRLDPPWAEAPLETAAALQRAARLQMEEAELLAEVGEGDRARTLAHDLERWSPAGLTDRRGRTLAELIEDLRASFGWYPYAPPRPAAPLELDLWRRVGGASDRDELRSIEFLPLRGPGLSKLDGLVVLARGLTVEVWSLVQQRRLHVLHGPDEGWFGGSLQGVDHWVPGGGILVSSIVAGEPADRSLVVDGDWVHSWNGAPVEDLPTFMQRVASCRPGRTLPVGIWRRGKKVLASFTAGRRPAAQGRLMQYASLYVDPAGRILVPGRTGLTWVDAHSGTRTPHWTWSEPGIVRRCDVVGDTALVTVQRGRADDVVVAVDLERGTERWRAAVAGDITWIAPVGSALWIQTLAPGQAWVVDRRDGRPRARYRTFDRHRYEFRKCWVPDREAAVAAGRGYLTTGTDHVHWFREVNTTRGTVEYQDAWEHAGPVGVGQYTNPQVAAGAYALVARGGGVRLYFPDPLGGGPRHILDASRQALLGTDPQHGPIDDDARLYVRGHRLFVVRLPLQGRRNVNVHIYGIDYEKLRTRPPTDTGPGASAFHLVTKSKWLEGSGAYPSRYVMHIRPSFEGIIVTAAQLTGDHYAESWYIADPGRESSGHDLRLFEGGMIDARRGAPVRVGSRLYVPTDAGARVFPVRAAGSR